MMPTGGFFAEVVMSLCAGSGAAFSRFLYFYTRTSRQGALERHYGYYGKRGKSITSLKSNFRMAYALLVESFSFKIVWDS
jgi:hypothetical protein